MFRASAIFYLIKNDRILLCYAEVNEQKYLWIIRIMNIYEFVDCFKYIKVQIERVTFIPLKIIIFGLKLFRLTEIIS